MSETNCPNCKKGEESGTPVTHAHINPDGTIEGFGYMDNHEILEEEK